MRFLRILVILYFLGCTVAATGQQGSLRIKEVTSCEIGTEGEFVLLSTIQFFHNDTLYTNIMPIVTDTSMLLPTEDCYRLLSTGKTWVRYRVLPFDPRMQRSLTHSLQKDTSITNSTGRLVFSAPNSKIINASDLQYNGSFTRGFSIGNAQNFVPNSNFNLQLNGSLGSGLEIAAAITDENLPIQPQGNTQVLQEFDRVYIELKKEQHRLIAGDYILERPKSYFMNYLKKLKGLGGETAFNMKQQKTLQTSANISSSRGKFRRQTLSIKEGNQGPYRLVGNNNERFIIVLSGSEKVWYNGELVKRGIEYDYVIDYNTADIVFTPNRLISKETRVIVEFEYTDQNYFRTLYTVNTGVNAPKWNVDFNFYSEQDSRNATSQISLDSTDRAILALSGDDRMQSFRSGIRQYDGDLLSPGIIGYKWTDNPDFPMGPRRILNFTDDRDSIEVTATFTEVGSGMGSYVISTDALVNGRVYSYVGAGNGNYEPIVQLVPPEQRRMMTLGGQYKLSALTNIQGELALSDFDINRLSAVDDDDNVGLAGTLGYRTAVSLPHNSKWQIVNHAQLELTDGNFNPLNPYRNAEFARDWNTPFAYTSEESLFKGGVGLSYGKEASTLYTFEHYKIKGLFEGYRQGALISGDMAGWKWTSRPSLTVASSDTLNTRFFRPNLKLSRTFARWSNLQLGIDYEGEVNLQKDNDNILRPYAYGFDYLKSFVQTNKDKPLSTRISFNKRVDRFALDNQLANAIDINEVEWGLDWLASKDISTIVTLKGRNFEVINPDLVKNETNKKTLLGSLDNTMALMKGAIQTTTNYNISSGQEPRQEFVFQEVENFKGEYVYIGPDTATVLEINDFRYDPTNPLASYIRISVPNNEFIKTNNIGFAHSLRIEPEKWLANDTARSHHFLKRFSSFSSIRFNSKGRDQGTYAYNPFAKQIADEGLISYSGLQTHTLYFNKANPKYDMTYTFRNNIAKVNQINGYEARGLLEHELRTRWGLRQYIDLIVITGTGRKFYDSELFDPRDFRISFRKVQPELNVRMSTRFRVIASYKYENRQQQINMMEASKQQEITLAANLRQASLVNINASVSLVNIKYTGDASSPIAYDIMDGLRAGRNVLTQLQLTRRLSNNLDLTVSYTGRKTASLPFVHLGKMQAKATF